MVSKNARPIKKLSEAKRRVVDLSDKIVVSDLDLGKVAFNPSSQVFEVEHSGDIKVMIDALEDLVSRLKGAEDAYVKEAIASNVEGSNMSPEMVQLFSKMFPSGAGKTVSKVDDTDLYEDDDL